MTKHLLRKGFEFKELEAAGLSREGHARADGPLPPAAAVAHPGVSGEVIGFGARRLFDDDQMEAKYVNTPETVLYKKSSVLFGLDLAKRDIAKAHQAVVVEGYTDVMAMHLAGVTTAVASCGTAFGDEHLAMLRRLMMDDNFFRGELIYVFDGDAAGRAAAVKAFDGEQNLAGQSFVAVAADGMDPCDLRLKSGDGALRDLVARRTPLFEFAIRTALAEHDLDSAEGRVAALRRCVPMVGQDQGPDAARRVRAPAGGLGGLGRRRPGHRQGARDQAKAGGAAATAPTSGAGRRRPASPDAVGGAARSARSDAVAAARGAEVGAAVPGVGRSGVRRVDRRELHPSRIRGGAGGDRRRPAAPSAGASGAAWIDAVRAADGSDAAASLVNELGVEAIRSRTTRGCRATSAGCWPGCRRSWVGRQIAEVKSKLQRMSPVEQGDEYHALFGDLVAMEAYRRSLLEQASGDDLTA